MASLDITPKDPTLEAADHLLEEKASREKPRPYLGMSSIGESCSRKIWYRFRFAQKEKFNAQTLKNFEDGHRTEDLVINRLRIVEGLELVSMIGGSQIRVTDHDGHFSGHLDGTVQGLIQAPKNPHVFEVKCTSEKKFNEFKKIVSQLGEKQALLKWNATYYGQAQMYMHYMGYNRHYIVIATAGGRDWTSARTEYNKEYALKLVAKAAKIIKTDKPPQKVSDSPDWFECRYCSFSEICHQQEMPDRNCRTCLHSTPIENASWHCARFGKLISLDEQIVGCPAQKLLPELVPGEIIEVTEKFIRYKLNNGSEWVDGE